MVTNDIGDLIRQRKMLPIQLLIVGLCSFVNFIDGFDVLAMAFTAPVVGRTWSISPKELGILLSAGLAGMAIGSVLLAPLADRHGRRANVLFCLVLMTIGMTLSAMAASPLQLLLTRFLTGLGIGGVLPSINTVVAEYASIKRRSFCISIMAVGYSAGATIGGLAAVFLIVTFGWRSVFATGAMLSAATIGLVALVMPESIDFILARGGADALGQTNRILARFRQPPLAELPERRGEVSSRTQLGMVLTPSLRGRTALACAAFFLAMTTFYFLLSWTPKIITDLGLSLQGGISASVLMNLAGVIGGLLLGAVSERSGLGRMLISYMVLCFASVIVFASVPAVAPMLLATAFLIGFFMNGVVCGLYALVPTIYPPQARATGAGLALGCGRVGATIGPFLAGVLIQDGWSRFGYFAVMALPMLASAVVVARIGSVTRRADSFAIQVPPTEVVQ